MSDKYASPDNPEQDTWQKDVRSQMDIFLADHPGLVYEVDPLEAMLKEAFQKVTPGALLLHVSTGRVDRYVRDFFGYPPYKPKVRTILNQLDDLAAQLFRLGLAWIPSLKPPVRLRPEVCAEFPVHSELEVQAFQELIRFVREHNVNPAKSDPKAGLTHQDHLACLAMLGFLEMGDILAFNLADAVAGFREINLEPGEPWTITTWFRNQERRWPLSWLSVIRLLMLIDFERKSAGYKGYLFGEKYFVNPDDEGDESREPCKDAKGNIIVHQVFNRWLMFQARQVQKAKRKIALAPSKVSLRPMVRAARILAVTNRPPEVVTYLSGRVPSAPTNADSFKALMKGEWSAKPPKDRIGNPSKKSKPKTWSDAPPVNQETRELGDQIVTSARAVLADLSRDDTGPNRERAELEILDLVTSNDLPPIPEDDSQDAHKSNLRWALLYLAKRLGEKGGPKAKTLSGEFGYWVNFALNWLGTKSLAGIEEADFTEIAVEYIGAYRTWQSQKSAKQHLKGFVDFLQDNPNLLLEPGVSASTIDWNHPDLSPDKILEARTVLVPGQIDEVINSANSAEKRLLRLVLLSLGNFCGLRESEALNLTAADIKLGLETIIIIWKSKTLAGKRKVPFSVLIPRPWRKEAVRYIRGLAGAAPETPIIPGGKDILANIEQELACFDASFHTLRHSAATLQALRLFFAYNLMDNKPHKPGVEKMRANMEEIHGLLFSKVSVLGFARRLLGPGWRKTQHMIIPVISKRLGHSEPGVTVNVYLHCLDLMAAATVPSAPEYLSQKEAAALLGKTRQTIGSWFKESPGKQGYAFDRFMRQCLIRFWAR